MRLLALLLSLACASVAVAAAPRITPEQAGTHRGQQVTLVGPVTEVQRRDDGVILMVGARARVAVIVPESALDRFERDLTELHQQTIEVTGSLTTQDKPLGLVLTDPDQLAVTPSQAGDVQATQNKVRTLEAENARLRAQTQPQRLQLITYGPGRKGQPIPPYALEFTVLADRGVPDRVEWGPRGRTLYYGRTRYTFDAQGQLIESR